MQHNFFELLEEDFGFGACEETASDKKTESGKKSDKKASNKTNTAGKKEADFEISLPVTVLARGFQYEIPVDSSEKLKISEMFEIINKAGYNEVCLPGVDCAYDAECNKLYITTNGVQADTDGSQVEFVDNMITVMDGMHKCELSIENFPGKDDDEVSCLDLTEYWVRVNPHYKGCKLICNDGIAYPVFPYPVNDKEAVALPVSIMVNGEWHDLSEADFTETEITAGSLKAKFFGMDNASVVPVLHANIDKSAYFLSYSQKKASTSKKGSIGTKKTEKKKIEEKYILPLEVFICTFGKTYSLTTDDFNGKEKITIKDVRKYFESTYKIFADDSRKLDAIYLKEDNLLSLNFISGKKGGHMNEYEEREFFGTHELLRSVSELSEVTKKPFFSGTLVNYKEYPDASVQVESFPSGTFLLEKESETLQIRSVKFEYKLPKIPAAMLYSVITFFRQQIENEAYCKLCFSKISNEYFLVTGVQVATPVSVKYTFDSQLFYDRNIIQVMDIHSHCRMNAFFSETDDKDECYPGIFCVIGKLDDAHPQIIIRAGYEGHFTTLSLWDVFDSNIQTILSCC